MAKKKNKQVDTPIAIVLGVLFVFVLFVGCGVLVNSSGDDDYPSPTASIDARSALISTWKTSYQNQKPITISYEELFRNSEKYEGKFIRLKGEVIQVLGEPGEWRLRVNVTDKGSYGVSLWEDTVLVTSYSMKRVIENDIVEFVGQSDGVTTYESTMGAEITIPALTTLDTPVVGRSE